MNFNLSINGESAQELADLGTALATLPATKKAEEIKQESPVTEEMQFVSEKPDPFVKPEPRQRAKATPKEEVKAEPKEEVKEQPAATASKITIEEIRAVQSEKSTSGKRDGVKALLAEFGVAKLTDMDEAQYSFYLLKLLAL